MGLGTTAAGPRAAPPDFCKLFESLPGLYLILDADFTIVAVNRAYAHATLIAPDAVLGRSMFEVFPDNPETRRPMVSAI